MPKKILIVDDDPDIVRIVRKRLEAWSYDVITASDGEEGLAKIKSESPDLVILDVVMPKLNGSTLCGIVKSDEKYKNMPVILLTVKKKELDREIGKMVKADLYITKPFEAEDLINKVDALLHKT